MPLSLRKTLRITVVIVLVLCLITPCLVPTFYRNNWTWEKATENDGVAIIVEFRSTNYLVAIVMNVLHNLPLDWHIQIFHGPSNRAFLFSSPTLRPHIISHRITLIELPQYTGGEADRHRFISELLTNSQFWSMVHGEHVLVFQMDTIFCSNSPYKITDFLKYDYIGAPWTEWVAKNSQHGIRVGNGGFSLRSRSKIRELLVRLPYNRTVHGDEDIYFGEHLPLVGGRLAPVDVARSFSGSFEYNNSMGLHKPRPQSLDYPRLCHICPEANLIPPFCRSIVINYGV